MGLRFDHRRGRYLVDAYDHMGKRRWKTLPEKISLEQAKDEEAAFRRRCKRGVAVSRGVKFEDVAADFVEHKKAHVRDTTLRNFSDHIRTHLKPFHGARVDRVTVGDVEKVFDRLVREGRLHIETVRKILRTLKQIFDYAVKHGQAEFNPALQAELKKGKRSKAAQGRILGAEEIRTLLTQEIEEKYRVLFLTAVFTGMRQGELLGLKWRDVDLDAGRIKVRRTYTKGKFYEPKTEGSRREVDIGPHVAGELRAWKERCPDSSMGLIFPGRHGRPMNYSNMTKRYFKPALRAAGLPDVRFHSLRHSYASIQLQAGEYDKVVQRQLGHSRVTTTKDIYAHLLEDRGTAAAARLEGRIRLPVVEVDACCEKKRANILKFPVKRAV